MHIGVEIERACESEHRLFVSKVTSMGKDSQFCFQTRAIINRIVDYFAQLKMRSGGRVTLKGKSEATRK